MTQEPIVHALAESAKDDALVRQFLYVWPDIESILEAFSRATKLPSFVYFNDIHVFQSSPDTMPHFCRCMMGADETRKLCMGDSQYRVMGQVPAGKSSGVQMCHAGMLNERREIESSLGTLTILFGSKKSPDPEASSRRESIIRITRLTDPALAERLQTASEAGDATAEFDEHDIKLMDAITDIVQELINATAVFRFLSINMAHELSLTLLNLGLIAREVNELLGEVTTFFPPGNERRDRLKEIRDMVSTQSHLGLYIVRNFLSHASETRYKDAVKLHVQPVNLGAVLGETIALHKVQAAEKLVEFENHVKDLPIINGFDMELRRLFSNIINNAIKHSYHSVPNVHRIIKVRGKVPYDPRPDRQRFAITFENYGLGLTEEEGRKVFRPGFRGKQAIDEVPIGSGIGLSEAQKIMKLHKGFVKLRSKELYRDDKGGPTYLTTVDLVFPYPPGRERNE